MVNENMIDFEKLLEIMKSKKKTLKSLAIYLGIDYSTLYRKFTGSSEFSRKEIIDTCLFLEIEDGSDIFFPKWVA